jgi:dethiobiotin synthetase
MATGLFVTGTDTGVGKTVVACALLRVLAGEGLRAVGFKPVAAGAVATDDGLRNEDALCLAEASNVERPYEEINPVVLESAIAPHIAAAAAGISIDVSGLAEARHRLAGHADVVITEGAGGWLVPTGPDATLADLAAAIGDPVVMVVGMRLGCLNHALLTAAAIRAHGLRLSGWIDNRIDRTMPALEENLATLDERLEAPRIGSIPWLGGSAADGPIRHGVTGIDRKRLLSIVATG